MISTYTKNKENPHPDYIEIITFTGNSVTAYRGYTVYPSTGELHCFIPENMVGVVHLPRAGDVVFLRKPLDVVRHGPMCAAGTQVKIRTIDINTDYRVGKLNSNK